MNRTARRSLTAFEPSHRPARERKYALICELPKQFDAGEDRLVRMMRQIEDLVREELHQEVDDVLDRQDADRLACAVDDRDVSSASGIRAGRVVLAHLHSRATRDVAPMGGAKNTLETSVA